MLRTLPYSSCVVSEIHCAIWATSSNPSLWAFPKMLATAELTLRPLTQLHLVFAQPNLPMAFISARKGARSR
jgi:hypothetical protein